MRLSLLGDIVGSLTSFFGQITNALGFGGILAICVGLEVIFVLLFAMLTTFSYEARLKRSLNKLNLWLFKNKKIDQSNLKEFNELIKKGPSRLSYYWQQYVLFREGDPSSYLSLENMIEKPLRTSSWANNIRNLNYTTIVWSIISFLFAVACQTHTGAGSGATLTAMSFAIALSIPALISVVGIIGAISLKGAKTFNLDDVYHIYHIFARFLNNACLDLPPYVDFDMLFSQKEIEKGNPQLREYYERRARQAKEEFENAKKSDIEYVEYNFEKAGVDGSLVLDRAMKETESFINKKTSMLAKIAHVEAQKEALKRNYENVQKDLQRKIQASKENIAKLISQQEATTNRLEVGFLRKQQEQEISKQEGLQQEYDQEETRYAISSEELEKEISSYRKAIDDSQNAVQNAMVAEYQSFYEKVMKSAYAQAERKVKDEKQTLKKERDRNEKELIIVQTQMKRLVDENNTLKARLGNEGGETQVQEGKYDENGNYVYADGSFHDPNGLYHDVDGNIFDMNGNLISIPEDEVEELSEEEQELIADEIAFGSLPGEDVKAEIQAEPLMEEDSPAIATEEEKAEEKPAAKTEKPKTGRGRPKKEKPVESPEPKEPKKRGRPKKEGVAAPKEKKPVGRPKASQSKKASGKSDISSLEKINQMISEEENKLAKMKSIINSELSDAIESERQNELNSERDEIMKAIEALKNKAESVKKSEKSEEELASINKRLEDLIHEISTLNNKK